MLCNSLENERGLMVRGPRTQIWNCAKYRCVEGIKHAKSTGNVEQLLYNRLLDTISILGGSVPAVCVHMHIRCLAYSAPTAALYL
jgi:hypothetical protein